MINILIVEDDLDLLNLFKISLSNEGYNCLCTHNGVDAINIFLNNKVDLIITDIMMPQMDGFKLSNEIRTYNQMIPILIVTARSDFNSLKKGYSTGIDDYMIKPINVNEMLLRIKALLRRAQINMEKKIIIGNTILNKDQMLVTYKNKKITLPLKEFNLLYKFLSFPGKIFTRQQLMSDIWGWDSNSDDRTINTHINRLREKFIDNDDFEIITIRGLGYKAVKHEE